MSGGERTESRIGVLWFEYSSADGDGTHRMGIGTRFIFIKRGRFQGVIRVVMMVVVCMGEVWVRCCCGIWYGGEAGGRRRSVGRDGEVSSGEVAGLCGG